MAEIKPFRAFLYDPDKINSGLENVCAPPYDVISPAMQDALHRKSDYNIVRLILGKAEEGDNDENNKYTRAGKIFSEWIKNGILARDGKAAFYAYLQEYVSEGRKARRLGFIGLMKIEEEAGKVVLPHENTLAAPKEDRLKLIKEVKGNLSPIFTIFPDSGGNVTEMLLEAAAGAPAVDIKIDGERNALWRIVDERAINEIAHRMKDKKTYIADGHHRYSVARSYRNIAREEKGYNGSADYVMTYFANMLSEENLTVLATHRVIKNMPVSGEDEIAGKAKMYFNVLECPNLAELKKRMKEKAAGCVFGYFAGKKFILLELKDEKSVNELVRENKSPGWKELDVSILHSGLLENILGMRPKEGDIIYVRDPEEAKDLVEKGIDKGAFFLRPTRLDQLMVVAEAGDMMPQKSTYFYPKLLSGLVINKFD